MINRHAKMQIEYKGDYLGIREMRKHASWYTQGYKNSSKLRARLSEIDSLESLNKILNEWKNS